MKVSAYPAAAKILLVLATITTVIAHPVPKEDARLVLRDDPVVPAEVETNAVTTDSGEVERIAPDGVTPIHSKPGGPGGPQTFGQPRRIAGWF
ncbi:MAG: hypothetical protein L6R40_003049 [Gallowayella cf. fulva]|nr:MAG: hypothetical protein L6R40_003049 [Xanthomendoza cf. fulva]